MRKISYTFLLLTFWCSVQGAIILPKSLRLAGPLNSGLSEFGDEFFNFPSFYQGMAPPGGTHLSGWITFDFEPPVEGKADFTMTFLSVGLDDQVQFPGGQIYTLLENRAFTNPAFISRGELDLETGEVENVEIHAIFQNGIIARVTKAIRIPLGFINDYPPTALPIDLPYEQRPSVDREARFLFDAATGRIIGFEFHGETTAPVTLFPLLGIFPPYSFGDNNRFYFSNPTGCVEGAPPENCPSDETNPDGVRLPNEAFFHPHLDLITRELQEVGDLVTPPCQLEGTASPNGLVALDGDLYHLGGIGAGQRVQVYSQETNQWGDAAPVPIGVIAAQSAAAGSKIHLVGGWVEAENRSTSLVQTFDPASDSWTFGSSAPIPVSGGVAVSVNSQVFVIGGWNNDRTGNPVLTADVQIYDPSTDSWTSGTSAPQATAGSSAVAVGNQIYLINGRIAGDRVTDQVWVYDVVANRWTESTPTLHGVYEAAATSTGDRIYLVGGRQEVGGPSVRIMQVYDSNPKDLQSKFWRNGLEPPVPTAAAAAVDGQVFVVGGRVMVGTDSAPGPVRGVVRPGVRSEERLDGLQFQARLHVSHRHERCLRGGGPDRSEPREPGRHPGSQLQRQASRGGPGSVPGPALQHRSTQETQRHPDLGGRQTGIHPGRRCQPRRFPDPLQRPRQ